MIKWFGSLRKSIKNTIILSALLISGIFLIVAFWKDSVVLYVFAGLFFAAFIFFLAVDGISAAQAEKDKQGKKRQELIEQLPENVPMKTADHMYRYTVAHGFGKGIVGWGKKHFKVLEHSLASDENATICFVAISETDSSSGFHAYAITNKRILCAQKRLIAGESVKSVNLDNLNDITFRTDLYHGYLELDTFKERMSLRFPEKADAKRLYALINEYFSDFKKKSNPSAGAIAQHSAADELRKFKQLLDEGILTQEEYDAKKERLLNSK